MSAPQSAWWESARAVVRAVVFSTSQGLQQLVRGWLV